MKGAIPGNFSESADNPPSYTNQQSVIDAPEVRWVCFVGTPGEAKTESWLLVKSLVLASRVRVVGAVFC